MNYCYDIRGRPIATVATVDVIIVPSHDLQRLEAKQCRVVPIGCFPSLKYFRDQDIA